MQANFQIKQYGCKYCTSILTMHSMMLLYLLNSFLFIRSFYGAVHSRYNEHGYNEISSQFQTCAHVSIRVYVFSITRLLRVNQLGPEQLVITGVDCTADPNSQCILWCYYLLNSFLSIRSFYCIYWTHCFPSLSYFHLSPNLYGLHPFDSLVLTH